MANTIFGYEVASPEQQRKTALAVAAFMAVMAVAIIVVFFLISHWEQAGRKQTLATITNYETKCRYVVRNIGKRVSYYDHTGYIGCKAAREVADANNNPLGSVQRRTFAAIEFTTDEGVRVRSRVNLDKQAPEAVGEQVEILYRVDKPDDVKEFVRVPLFGKKSIAPKSKLVSARSRTDTVAPKKQRFSDTASESTKFWIGLTALLIMALTAFWLLKRLYRLLKWLAFGSREEESHQITNRAAPANGVRINRVVQRSPRGSFGQR